MTSDLDDQALLRVAVATGGWATRPDRRRKTFVTVTGRRFHLRTYEGKSDDWFFGVNKRFWDPAEWFLLACGGPPAFFVLPVEKLNKFDFPFHKDDRKLHVVLNHGRWILRDPNPPIPIDEYRDAFELLQ